MTKCFKINSDEVLVLTDSRPPRAMLVNVLLSTYKLLKVPSSEVNTMLSHGTPISEDVVKNLDLKRVD